MTPIRKVTAYDCTCSQCGHNWLAREIPARCAKCKRRSWNLKKGEKVQIGRPRKSVRDCSSQEAHDIARKHYERAYYEKYPHKERERARKAPVGRPKSVRD